MSLILHDNLQQKLSSLVVVAMRMTWSNTLQIALVLSVIVVALAYFQARHVRREKALEHTRARYASGLALVRYVQLSHQCSEPVAYQLLATFVKKHLPADGSSSIELMAACERQRLLERAQGLLTQDPDAIDRM